MYRPYKYDCRQFTGIYDCIGTPIYVGDVLESNYNGEGWCTYRAPVRQEIFLDNNHKIRSTASDYRNSFEFVESILGTWIGDFAYHVIGNVFFNPNLKVIKGYNEI